MREKANQQDPVQKERIRQEISRHVEAFLRQGGEIAVLDSCPRPGSSARSSTWQDEDDLYLLID